MEHNGDGVDIAHSENARKGIFDEAKRLEEEGMSPVDAMRVAAATMDGAGEGATVESMQTCRDLFGEVVPGLTTDDSNEPRSDRYSRTEAKRHSRADSGTDLTALWLKLAEVKTDTPGEGKEIANKMLERVMTRIDKPSRYLRVIRECVQKDLSGETALGILKDMVADKVEGQKPI